MTKERHKLIERIASLASLCLFALAITVTTGLANGEGKHDKDEERSTHMQAMYALKDRIPEEYRIMERTPVLPDDASLARGEELYQQQCAVCHGPKGRGDGPAAQSLKPPPANFRDLEHSRIYGPGEKFWIIGNGSGEAGMPAFPQLDLVDRWHLVNHIYALQKEAGAGHDHGHSH